MEAGCGLGHEGHCSALLTFWSPTGSWADQVLLISPSLNSSVMSEASVRAGSAAQAAERHKHQASDEKCQELGWACIPLAIEAYRCWGTEARQCLSRIANCLAVRLGWSLSKATTSLYGKLSLALIRANDRAILSRTVSIFVLE